MYFVVLTTIMFYLVEMYIVIIKYMCFCRNSNFYGNRQTQLVSKRQISDHVQAHLENIVCCRMREGFIIEVSTLLIQVIQLNKRTD